MDALNPIRRRPRIAFPVAVWLIGAVFAFITPAGAAETPKITNLEQAAKLLAHPDAVTRGGAVAWFAGHGRDRDAARLAPRLRDDDESVRAMTEQAMWLMWGRSGDREIDRLYLLGSRQMSNGDLVQAMATFTEIIRRKPEFAEGWNKRATVYFMSGELQKSLADCDEVIKRNSLHFGALSGYGQIYFQLGDYEKALDYFRQALEVNPNMSGVQNNIRGLERLIGQKQRNST
jgi:tetratricopeptide (TPR) repeat protein